MKTEVQGILWSCDGVLTDAKHPKRPYDRLPEILQHFTDNGITMGVVDRLETGDIHARLQEAGLSDYFERRVYSAAGFSSDIREGEPLTQAFCAAFTSLDLDMRKTVGVIGRVLDVRLVRSAGLPVAGFTGGSHISPESVHDIKARMVDRLRTPSGAFCAASAMIDLAAPIMQFRPQREAEWHPIGQLHK